MITMEQLEKLEGRIVKALDLISDLRIENSQLESKVDTFELNNQQLKLKAEEKIKEAENLEKQLQEATGELNKLKSREQELETKILQIIAKLDNLKEGHSPFAAASTSAPEPESDIKTDPSSEPALPDKEQEVVSQDSDHSELIVEEEIGEEAEESIDTSVIKDEEPLPASPDTKADGADDDFVVLDEGGSELILDDDESETPAKEAPDKPVWNSVDESETEDDENNVLGVFDDDDNDDFLIIEDEDKPKEEKKE